MLHSLTTNPALAGNGNENAPIAAEQRGTIFIGQR
jgi:hypothetical protein